MKRRNRANHTPHARLFVDAQPPGHVSFTYKELTESLRRKSRQLSIGQDARKQTKHGKDHYHVSRIKTDRPQRRSVVRRPEDSAFTYNKGPLTDDEKEEELQWIATT